MWMWCGGRVVSTSRIEFDAQRVCGNHSEALCLSKGKPRLMLKNLRVGALKAGALVAVVGAAALVSVGTAQAATGATVSTSGNQIAYIASGGAKNKLEVTAEGGFYWFDDVVDLAPGNGCAWIPGQDKTVVRCNAAGIASISIYTAGGDDVVDARIHSVWIPMLILGGTGDDLLAGQMGNDVIEGGSDADRLYGNSGNDTIFAGHRTIADTTAGNTLIGGGGDDDMYGGSKNDTFDGQQGNDYMWGDAGNDDMRGGSGNDHIRGFNGDDHIRGDEGDDTLEGGANVNIVDGGANYDVCSGGPTFRNCEQILG